MAPATPVDRLVSRVAPGTRFTQRLTPTKTARQDQEQSEQSTAFSEKRSFVHWEFSRLVSAQRAWAAFQG
jgi:hypothetical protein